jgi:hypothetical protein
MFVGGLDNDPAVGLKVLNGFGLRERNHDLKAPGVEFLAQTDQGHIGIILLRKFFCDAGYSGASEFLMAPIDRPFLLTARSAASSQVLAI